MHAMGTLNLDLPREDSMTQQTLAAKFHRAGAKEEKLCMDRLWILETSPGFEGQL